MKKPVGVSGNPESSWVNAVFIYQALKISGVE